MIRTNRRTKAAGVELADAYRCGRTGWRHRPPVSWATPAATSMTTSWRRPADRRPVPPRLQLPCRHRHPASVVLRHQSAERVDDVSRRPVRPGGQQVAVPVPPGARLGRAGRHRQVLQHLMFAREQAPCSRWSLSTGSASAAVSVGSVALTGDCPAGQATSLQRYRATCACSPTTPDTLRPGPGGGIFRRSGRTSMAGGSALRVQAVPVTGVRERPGRRSRSRRRWRRCTRRRRSGRG